VTLDQLTDHASLLQAAKLLEAENLALAKLVAKLKTRLLALEGKEAVQLQLQIEDLEASLAQARQQMFGESSERREPTEGAAKEKPPKSQKTGHGRREQSSLEIVERVHTQAADEKCSVCGGETKEWSGQFEESEEIDVIERRFVVTKHKRQKYRCSCGSCIQTAPGPTKLFDGARYSVGFAVEVATSKYADHLPLERQVKMMAREGLKVDSQTLWDQIDWLAFWLEPAHKALGQYILTEPAIGADETHWRMMGKKESASSNRWHVWAIATDRAVSYRISPSRSTEAAKAVLGGYQGTVMTDGYAAYSSLKKQGERFRLAHCWAHVRRKFVEIEAQYPKECGEVLDWIGKLYQIERDTRDGPPARRLAIRAERSREVVWKIRDWALETKALPQSNLGKAIAYMGGVWDGLQVFLSDPLVELDNNRTERAIRGVVVGRKNHYGSRSKRGTEVAALFYSLIESAKLADLDPKAYLKVAIDAALRKAKIPLPHEVSGAPAL
jgi:transposase